MIQDMVSGLADEISYNYCHLKEKAIYRNIIKAEGMIPDPDTLKLNGMFCRIRQGLDDYEEFRWKNIPMFQIRIKFNDMAATIKVTDL